MSAKVIQLPTALPSKRTPLGRVIFDLLLVSLLEITSEKSVKGVSTADFTDLSLVTKLIDKSWAEPDGLAGGAFFIYLSVCSNTQPTHIQLFEDSDQLICSNLV